MVTYKAVLDKAVAYELLQAEVLYWGYEGSYVLASITWGDWGVHDFPLYRDTGEPRFFVQLED